MLPGAEAPNPDVYDFFRAFGGQRRSAAASNTRIPHAESDFIGFFSEDFTGRGGGALGLPASDDRPKRSPDEFRF